jgi:hypothetical protein
MKLVLKRSNIYTVIYDYPYPFVPGNYFHINGSTSEREQYHLVHFHPHLSLYHFTTVVLP